jgi:uncharacterized protein
LVLVRNSCIPAFHELAMPGSDVMHTSNDVRSWTSVLLFFLISFGVSWVFWGIAICQERGWLAVTVPTFGLMILGGLGPLIAANVVAALEGGRDAVGRLWRQLGRWRLGWIWYGLLPVIFLMRLVPLALPVFAGQSLDWASAGQQLAALPILFVFVALVGGGLDEEMGWRGFALGRLQTLLHPLYANLLLGIVWACWHLPLWLIPGTSQASASFAVYVVSTVSLSFILGWIYNATRQSLLLVVLAHTISNLGDTLRYGFAGFPNPVFDTGPVDILLATVFALWAVAIVIRTKGRLGHTHSAAHTRGN